MKQLTRQEVEAIMISFFLKKWHKVGEPKPIYIGTVLEKMKENCLGVHFGGEPIMYHKLVELWSECGFSKSLQEIISDSKWEEIALLSNPPQKIEVLTSPEANALFSFLQEIGL